MVIGVVSGGLATLAAWQFGKETAVIKAAIIYTGLPNSGANSAFDPLGAATGAEMVTSVKVLSQLCARRGLEMPPSRMAELITTNVGRSSSLINLSLIWRDVDDGIAMLNELTSIFIEEMASQRKAILQQHLQHLDIALVQAKGRVDEARSQLAGLQSQQRQQLDKGGLSNDKYRSAMQSLETTKAKVADKFTELQGTEEQIAQLDGNIDEFDKKQQSVADGVKKDLLHEAEAVLTKAHSEYRPSSDGARQINDTIAAIKKLVQSPDSPKDIRKVAEAARRNTPKQYQRINGRRRKKLDEAFAHIQKQHEGEFNCDRRTTSQSRGPAQPNAAVVDSHSGSSLRASKHRKSILQTQADKLGEQITGISATQLDEAEHQLQEAEKQQDNLADQSNTLAAVVGDSNSRMVRHRSRIDGHGSSRFQPAQAVHPGLRRVLLCVDGAAVRFRMARSKRLAAGAVGSFAARARAGRTNPRTFLARTAKEQARQAPWAADQTEIVRMLTLRIQQTCHRPGSVVLFSSLDSSFSTVPLMVTVAECLAEREERVLIIDAVCPRRALIPVFNVLSSDELPALPKKAKKSRTALPPVAGR